MNRLRTNLGSIVSVGLCLALASSLFSAEQARPETTTPAGKSAAVVDHRYAPMWWQTSICLPDDWQKTLVGKEGTLLYDFPGKHSGFKTRIGLSLGEGEKWVHQELASPRVPIVRTVTRIGEVEAIQEAFALAPPDVAEDAKKPQPVVERVDGEGGQKDWAAPRVPCDPAFRDVAIGWNGAVHYRVRAAAGQSYTVVLGLCEGWHPKAGQRVLDLKIESKTRKTVDMVASHGRNVPAMFPLEARDENGDGWIDVEVAPAAGSADQNTVLNVLWVFQGSAPTSAELLAGQSSRPALAHINCGTDPVRRGPPRRDMVTLALHNTGATTATVRPIVTIDSEFPLQAAPDRDEVTIGDGTTLYGVSCAGREEGKGKMVLRLPETKLEPGRKVPARVVFLVLRGVRSPTANQLDPYYGKGVPRVSGDKAVAYWTNLDLPYGRIEVPDAGIQAQFDGSIRNIYQAREIKKGLPAFQVGPTCYRGLWVVDGSFLMESVALLGRADEARNGIRYLLSFQRDDGAIMIMNGHWKETGITLWAVTRHARLTGDKAWLEEVWPKLERGWAYIGTMRQRASADPKAPNFGLIPEGFADGGLGGTHPEYTNIYWTLTGMKAAVDAARWLGKSQQADTWQRQYDDFYACFRRAAERDMKVDKTGNRYVPITMHPQQKESPQKAQWAFLHAVYPGRVFAADDPLVRGNMAMLKAVECEGLVRDTGWVSNGVWNYFASFYAHGWLWLGDGAKAGSTLYDFANHASPLLCWREEQMPVGEGPAQCGDMPHNWGSAEFIRLVCHLLVLERGDELHLFEGLPRQWIRPGQAVRVQGVLTEFGPISLELRVSADGSKATLSLDPPRRDPPKRIVVHPSGWSAAQGTIELPVDRKAVREIPL